MNKKGLNIFLVDDDRIYQFTARKTIESIDLVNKVFIFSNGEEAINYLEENSFCPDKLPDVIFLDINMPVMNGWAFLEAFGQLYKNLTKSATIFMVSSSVDESDIKKAKEYASVRQYVNKPISREKLETLLLPFIEEIKTSNVSSGN